MKAKEEVEAKAKANGGFRGKVEAKKEVKLNRPEFKIERTRLHRT